MISMIATVAPLLVENILETGESDEDAQDEISNANLALYAERKRARKDWLQCPREMDPGVASSIISGSPRRSLVNVHRIHRLPINVASQEKVMSQ